MTSAADGFHPERLGVSDIDDAMRLVVEAGWNQTDADWAMMMKHGYCIGIRQDGGHVIATSLALPMGGSLGWISMVLVAKAWRRQGLASRLVSQCVDWLEAQGITPLLDATPDGAKVYATMGFHPLLGLTRWQRAGRGEASRAVEPLETDAQAFLTAYDLAVFGAPRPFILTSLAERGPHIVRATGFLLGRKGRQATQIGPVSASGNEEAVGLLQAGLAMTRGPVFIDVFDAQTGFVDRLQEFGFTPQRHFTRMAKGRLEAHGDAARSFAAAGPELG